MAYRNLQIKNVSVIVKYEEQTKQKQKSYCISSMCPNIARFIQEHID